MHATVRLAPAFSFGAKDKLIENSKSPGPAAYTLPTTIDADGTNTIIGQKFSEITKEITPSPSQYSTVPSWNSTTRKAPQFSFGRRFKLPSGDKTPGSGAYTPNIKNVLSRSSSYTMASRLDKKNKMMEVPGPAAYDIHKTWSKVKNAAPQFSVSHRPKEIRRMSTPGPNAYRPKKAVKSMPSYTMRPRTSAKRSNNGPGPAAYNIGSQFGLRR
jgi:hypothetical protein